MENSNEQFQGQTKKCPKCQEDIQLDAKKCKHCGADLRNWFVRHKIISIVVGVIIIFILLALLGKPETNDWKTIKISIITACEKKGGSSEDCKCAFGVLKKNYTAKELSQFEKVPASLIEKIAKECSKDTPDWRTMKISFITTCEKEGGSSEYCECAFGVVKKNYTAKEFSQLAQLEKLPANFIEKIAKECDYE